MRKDQEKEEREPLASYATLDDFIGPIDEGKPAPRTKGGVKGYRNSEESLRDLFKLGSLYRAYWMNSSKDEENTMVLSTFFSSNYPSWSDLDIEAGKSRLMGNKLMHRIENLEKEIEAKARASEGIQAMDLVYGRGLDKVEKRILIMVLYSTNFIENDLTVMEVASVLETLGVDRSEVVSSLLPEGRLVREGYVSLVKDELFEGKRGILKSKVLVPDKMLRKLFDTPDKRTEGIRFGRLLSPRFEMDRIVLPASIMETLHLVIAQERKKFVIYDEWGIKDIVGHDHIGLKMLFYGPPGTGKTATAEAIAHELGKNVLMVDFPSVVDSYVGETAKNISYLFKEAKAADAVLLIDEADAIVSTRTKVRSTLDSELNRDVNVMLQEIERYDDILILTTNMEANLDPALARRIQFRFGFETPGPRLRERLWEVHIPKGMPLAKDVDPGILSRRYEMTGSEIKTAVVNAARLALHRSDTGSNKRVKVSMADFVKAIESFASKKSGKKEVSKERRLRGYT